eukprot:GHVO01032981.1.p1 GENE.GHVO01032981.1~~GHVO01032981.1.p1  ORF type:complete len:134 (-),score=29.19 GHVO01032981.1:103-504(-)
MPWTNRLSVLIEAAQGLAHLHGGNPLVFHRDIKSANILLDKFGTGKLADFGLSCLATTDTSSRLVRRAEGTPGYADPRYIETLEVTEATEIYAFGMIVLEILTGRPPAVYADEGKKKKKKNKKKENDNMPYLQ